MLLFTAYMASRKKIREARFRNEFKQETIQAILAIVFFVLAVLSLLAPFHLADPVGKYVYEFLQTWFGLGYFLLPISFILASIAFLKGIKTRFRKSKIIGVLIFFLAGLGLMRLLADEGGHVGKWVTYPFIELFDVYATAAILISCISISILVIFEMHFTLEHLMFWKWFRKSSEEGEIEKEEEIEPAVVEIENKIHKPEIALVKIAKDEEGDIVLNRSYSSKAFTPPPLSLLESDRGKPETGDIKANANIIKRTLQNFGIDVEMDEISIGPSVTRYALKPAEGVKLSRIVALNNDLAL